MSIQKLADNLYIAPQLTEADVQEAAKLGIQTVICNRPDGCRTTSRRQPEQLRSPPATSIRTRLKLSQTNIMKAV